MEGLCTRGAGAPPQAGAHIVGDSTEGKVVVDGDISGGVNVDGVDSPRTTLAFLHSLICNSSSCQM